MKQQILDSLHNPENLEKLYREHKQDFSKSLAEISDSYDSELLRFWKIRLAPDKEPASIGFLKLDLVVVIILSLVTGLLVKLPDFFARIPVEFFYTRNLAIIVFNGIILFTFWQNRIFDKSRILSYGFAILSLSLFINLLPNTKSDSLILTMIHIPLFLWCLFGLSFISFDYKTPPNG